MFHFNWLQHLASETSIKSEIKMLLVDYVGHIDLRSLTDGHLGRHLEYFKALNDARVASVGFIKYNASTTRINKEKKNFKIKFQVILVFYWTILAYVLDAQKNRLIETVLLSTNNIWFG